MACTFIAFVAAGRLRALGDLIQCVCPVIVSDDIMMKNFQMCID